MHMKSIIFDGRKYALEMEQALAMRVLGLRTRGVYPKLASIIVGSDPASVLYVNLKKKAAERIGAEVDIYRISKKTSLKDLLLLIETLNEDEQFQGIMIQMPIPGALSESREEIINAILPSKDVDGLRHDSDFLHPTSKAVVNILHFAEKETKTKPDNVCVVGATGMVGTPLTEELETEGYKVVKCDLKTEDLKREVLGCDAVISTTGTPNIISPEIVKKGSIVIDVGSPKGDVEFAGVSKKASFITPVPGGVGPVTISELLENLISAC